MTSSVLKKPTTSFTTKRINRCSFVIREDDAWEEHPLIYVKLHPLVPLIILTDTGCDEPREKYKRGMKSSCISHKHYIKSITLVELHPAWVLLRTFRHSSLSRTHNVVFDPPTNSRSQANIILYEKAS